MLCLQCMAVRTDIGVSVDVVLEPVLGEEAPGHSRAALRFGNLGYNGCSLAGFDIVK